MSTNSELSTTNALAKETSPYLLQHAHNPVHWFPWGAEALEKAHAENKPILLSVGYSSCHWCHVMAHESFESESTAEVMNRHFVNIKVDREERPDLDKIYQMAHQLIARRAGGWPLTMFLEPEGQRPFFGGTYFPDRPRHGMPAFVEVLKRVAEYYEAHETELRDQAQTVARALAQVEPESDLEAELHPQPIGDAREQLLESFDKSYGGFGDAPKFPHPTNVELLLRNYAASATAGARPDMEAYQAGLGSIAAMASGGLYDQIGGGFCRYSVDPYWMIPHFEKMLYDNGPLLALSAQAWQLTGAGLFARVGLKTAAWVIEEMQSPDGGYFSSYDADSEGMEGKYYIWSPQEVSEALTPEEYAVFAPHYGLDRPPNFESEHWHLHTFVDVGSLMEQQNLDEQTVEGALASAREKLLSIRRQRVAPGRDDKILTSWNALMIKGMSIAAQVFKEPKFAQSADRALGFIQSQLHHDARLLAVHKSGRSRMNAYLDDYAFTIDATLSLLANRWRTEDLRFAMGLAETLLEHFEDRERGGFYFTSHDHEDLIHRSRTFMDESLPAGNGIAASALMHLGHLTGEERFIEAAERTLKAAWSGVLRYPAAHNSILIAAEDYLSPPQTIVIRGDLQEIETWRQRCHEHFAPQRRCYAIPDEDSELPGLLAQRAARDKTVAYVCSGFSCRAPIFSLEDLELELAKTEVNPDIVASDAPATGAESAG